MFNIAHSHARRMIQLALVATMLAWGGLPAVVLAVVTAPIAREVPSGQGLEIQPPVIELNAKPGQTVTANIKIRDITPSNLVVTGQADDFAAQGENGDPRILLDETEATRYSLKFWVESVPSFNLVPREIKTAVVRINVPKNAEPGGHYAVIRFTGTPPDLAGTGVSLAASIGALVLLRVAGPVSEKISLSEFYVARGDARSTWFETGPLSFVTRVKNEGSVHIKPTGTIDVYDSFGKTVAVLPVNQPPRNILPDSTRKFLQPLFDKQHENKFLFGRYRAKLNLSLAAGQSPLAASLVFWVIPYRLIASLFLLLVIAFFSLRWAIRRYNRHIIKRARR